MELTHASDILNEALRQTWAYEKSGDLTVLDLLIQAQDRLGYSDGCRTMASRMLVRTLESPSLTQWHNQPRSKEEVIGLLMDGLMEIRNTPRNPYMGFLFCTCIAEMRPVLAVIG